MVSGFDFGRGAVAEFGVQALVSSTHSLKGCEFDFRSPVVLNAAMSKACSGRMSAFRVEATLKPTEAKSCQTYIPVIAASVATTVVIQEVRT